MVLRTFPCLTHSFVFLIVAGLTPALAFDPPVTPPGQSKKPAKITWLTPKHSVGEALLANRQVEIEFTASRDLEKIVAWLTPSLAEFLKVEPEALDSVPKDTPTKLKLSLLVDSLPHTVGGTLHLRPTGAENDTVRRTLPPPFPVNVKVPGSDDDDEEATVNAVVGAADYDAESVAPGGIVSVFGQGLGPSELAHLQVGKHGRVTDYLADAQVLFDGIAGPILAARHNQVNVVVPFETAGESEVEVMVTYKGLVGNPVLVPLHAAAPALFTLHGLGHGRGAILNEDLTLNSPENPAPRGSVIMLFATGAGLYKEGTPTGAIVSDQLPHVLETVQVLIGGVAGTVEYAGGAPTLVSSVVQINVRISMDTPTGDAVPVQLVAGDRASKAQVTVAIR